MYYAGLALFTVLYGTLPERIAYIAGWGLFFCACAGGARHVIAFVIAAGIVGVINYRPSHTDGHKEVPHENQNISEIG